MRGQVAGWQDMSARRRSQNSIVGQALSQLWALGVQRPLNRRQMRPMLARQAEGARAGAQCLGRSLAVVMHDVCVATLLAQFTFRLSERVRCPFPSACTDHPKA